MWTYIKLAVLCCLILGLTNSCGSSPLTGDSEDKEHDDIKWIKRDDFGGDGQGEVEHHNRPLDDDLCAICNKNLGTLTPLKFDCNHSFHEHCIREWWQEFEDKRREECPVCLAELQLDNEPFRTYNTKLWNQIDKLMAERWGVVGAIDASNIIY